MLTLRPLILTLASFCSNKTEKDDKKLYDYLINIKYTVHNIELKLAHTAAVAKLSECALTQLHTITHTYVMSNAQQ